MTQGVEALCGSKVEGGKYFKRSFYETFYSFEKTPVMSTDEIIAKIRNNCRVR